MWKKLLSIFFLLVVATTSGVAFADDTCASLSGQAKIDCYSKKVADTQGQERTLSSQISGINNQISLTRSQIDLTE